MWKDPEIYQDVLGMYRWQIERVEPGGGKSAIHSPKSHPTRAHAKENLDTLSRAIVAGVFGMRPSVIGFAIKMERQLREHDMEKGDAGWLAGSPLALLAKLIEEVGEVGELLLQPAIPPEKIREECADVGNVAMMVADRVAGFPL